MEKVIDSDLYFKSYIFRLISLKLVHNGEFEVTAKRMFTFARLFDTKVCWFACTLVILWKFIQNCCHYWLYVKVFWFSHCIAHILCVTYILYILKSPQICLLSLYCILLLSSWKNWIYAFSRNRCKKYMVYLIFITICTCILPHFAILSVYETQSLHVAIKGKKRNLILILFRYHDCYIQQC